MSDFPVYARSTTGDVIMFIALLATALAMGGALAHALALPNKMAMAREDYFVAQQIYAGWNRLAWLLAVQLVALVALAAIWWNTSRVLVPVIVAILALAAAQIVFWIWTFPANTATDNWTSIPDNWRTLRAQWEYSHLAGFGFQLLSLSAVFVAALTTR